MAQLLVPIAERRGDAPALIDEFGETSWTEFNTRVNRLIHALRGAGLSFGSTVAVLSGNRREYFELLAASAHAGWILVPINWHFAADEVRYVLENSDASVLFADERFGALAAEAVDGLASVATRVMMGGIIDGFEGYESLLSSASDHEPEDQGIGGPMFYTSGTTGRPKGVRTSMLGGAGGSLDPLNFMFKGFAGVLGIPEDGVTLLCGPVYHSAQWAFSMFPLGNGSTIVMRHRFDPAETLELIDRHKVTNIHLVPTQFVRLLRVEEEDRDGFSGQSLKAVWHGAAPCPRGIKQKMIDWWGPIVTEYYGGTEGAIVSLISAEDWQRKPDSVGQPIGTVEVLVVDDEGKTCPTGMPGQLYLKSKIGMDFEYHKEPAKTEGAHLEPGVFTLGDIGFLDDEGFLHLSDRKIDMIISGGVNIYPAEIESVLSDHPSVRDVAVFGIPDEEFGEQVKAAIELIDGVDASEDLASELMAFSREHLAGYKTPKTIDFHESLPRHPTGKLYKRLLRDPYWEGHDRKI